MKPQKTRRDPQLDLFKIELIMNQT